MAKILFLAPYEGLKDSVLEAYDEFTRHASRQDRGSGDCEIEVLYLQDLDRFDPGLYKADILVSRGAMVPYLRHTFPDRPVVELAITTIDIVNAVRRLRETHPERTPIAIVGFGDLPSQFHVASSICGEILEPFRYFSERIDLADLAAILDAVAARGFKEVIGGARTVALARNRGLAAEVITNGLESILPAIAEATHIARIRRTERERAARLQTILDHVGDGIIATDLGDRIVQINAAAAEMTGLDPEDCAGIPLGRALPDPRIFSMLRDDRACKDELVAMGGNRYVLSKSAIRLEEQIIGNLVTLQRVSAVQDTEKKIRNRLYSRGLTAKYSFDDIVGESPALREAIRKAKIFAATSSNILILGETGTGKELFAQSIHRAGARREGPFVAVNCAAIPDSLIESEFFGHEPGAFTGALREGRPGYFELAHEGTIFLDEVSEIPLRLQGKLLRVIQEGELIRIGSDRVVAVDVRIVAAVNHDLLSLVGEGKFRKDLYYRLAVLQLRLPALRERGGDVLLLAERFLRRFEAAFGKGRVEMSEAARRAFLAHPWEGNVRELSNLCEQIAALNVSGAVSEEDLAFLGPSPGVSAPSVTSQARRSLGEIREIERTRILQALDDCGFNRTKAAAALRMDRSTLWRKLKEHGIELRTSPSPAAGETAVRADSSLDGNGGHPHRAARAHAGEPKVDRAPAVATPDRRPGRSGATK